MNNGKLVALGVTEIEAVNGGIGGLPPEPTFQDYIDLSDQFAQDTLDRLTRNNVVLPPVT